MLHLKVFLIIVAVATAHSVYAETTSVEEYPHQVSVGTFYAVHFCGGSLVTLQHVVTAANCVEKKLPKDVIVRTGTSKANLLGDYYSVDTITLHPNYNKTTSDCDVAVIKLRVPVTTGVKVKPINIAPLTAKPQPGEVLLSTGWGFNPRDNRFKRPANLKVERVRTLTNPSCASIHGQFLKITNNMICVKGNVESSPSREGDVGGPLINEKKQLVGVLSWERSRGPDRNPEVYTAITSPQVHKFIEENTK